MTPARARYRTHCRTAPSPGSPRRSSSRRAPAESVPVSANRQPTMASAPTASIATVAIERTLSPERLTQSAYEQQLSMGGGHTPRRGQGSARCWRTVGAVHRLPRPRALAGSGREVSALRPRGQSLAERLDQLVEGLGQTGTLSGAVRVPDAVASVGIVADLRARQLTTSVVVDAPPEGRATARVNWMLRQLRDAATDVRLTVAFAGSRETTSLLLGEARTSQLSRLVALTPLLRTSTAWDSRVRLRAPKRRST